MPAKGERFLLQRADFERLWAQAKTNRAGPTTTAEEKGATLLSALYRVRFNPDDLGLTLSARYTVSARGQWASTVLALKEGDTLAVPTAILMDGQPTSLAPDQSLLIEHAGVHVIDADYAIAKPKRWTEAKLFLPAASSAMMQLVLSEADGAVQLADKSLIVTDTLQGSEHILTAPLVSATELGFTRLPRRAVLDTPPPSAALTLSLQAHEDLSLQTNVWLEFAFPTAARRVLETTLDPAWDIGHLWLMDQGRECHDFRATVITQGDTQRLRIESMHDLRDAAELRMHLRPHGSSVPASLPQMKPIATRTTGKAIFAAEPAMQLTAQPSAAQARVPSVDVTMRSSKVSAPAYRFTPGDAFAFTLNEAPSKTEGHVDYLAQVSAAKVELFAMITLKRKRGEWRQQRLTLPAGYAVQNVSGDQLESWELTDRDLHLRFTNSTKQETKLLLYIARTASTPVTEWTLEPLVFQGLQGMMGEVLLAGHAAVELRLPGFTNSDSLREIDVQRASQAFAVVSPNVKQRAVQFTSPTWALKVAVLPQAARFNVDSIALVQATDAGVLISQQVLLKVEEGALRSAKLRLPAALPEALVKCPLLREARSRIDGETREYDITFQSQGGLLGETSITLEMQLPLTDAVLSAPFIDVPGSAGIRRWFVLENASARETVIVKQDGVDAASRESLPVLPEKAAQPRYFAGRSSGTLEVKFAELQSTAVDAAIITLTDIATVLRADGERWDTVTYSLQNRSLQFLPVILPDKAELIATSVSGEAVRADERPGAAGQRVRLIPLIQTKPGQLSMEVRLIYRLRLGSLPKALSLDDPEVPGISSERTLWSVSMPKGHQIASTFNDEHGNMDLITQEGREAERLNQMLSDYTSLNRWLSSAEGREVPKEKREQVLAEAESLSKNLQLACVAVTAANSDVRRISSSNGYLDESQVSRMQVQVSSEMQQFQKQLDTQNVTLTENRVAQPVFSTNKLGRQTMENGWASKEVGKDEFKTKSGTGRLQVDETLRLSGANTYTGGVKLDGGTLVLNQGRLNSREEMVEDTITANNVHSTDGFGLKGSAGGSTIRSTRFGNDAIKPDSVDGLIRSDDAWGDLNAPKLNLAAGGTLTLGGVITGTGGITKVGAGDITITQTGTAMPAPGAKAKPVKAADDQELFENMPKSPPPLAAPAAAEPAERQGKLLATMDVAQLRPTGRRSLALEVPSEAVMYHFRKLRDHAQLDLTMKQSWSPDTKAKGWFFGLSLASWCGLLGLLRWKRKTR